MISEGHVKLLAVSTSAIVLLACDVAKPGGAVQLSAVPAKTVFVAVSEEPSSPPVTLRLHYDDKKDEKCKTLDPGVAATFNGAPLQAQDLGSKTSGILNTGIGAECVAAKWVLTDRKKLPPRDAAATTVELTDSSGTVTFEAQSLMATRTITLRSPATPTFRRGDRVVLDFMPATDSLEDIRIQVELPACSAANRETLATVGSVRPPGAGTASVAGNQITFTVPIDLPAVCNGTAPLDVSSNDAHGIRVGVAKCTGADTCIARVGRFARLAAVTIAAQ